jgi:tetratricopeptide (TPR) repeat protein
MLTEEALLALTALIACGMVVLGFLELQWPSRPRRAVRPGSMATRRGEPLRRRPEVSRAIWLPERSPSPLSPVARAVPEIGGVPAREPVAWAPPLDAPRSADFDPPVPALPDVHMTAQGGEDPVTENAHAGPAPDVGAEPDAERRAEAPSTPRQRRRPRSRVKPAAPAQASAPAEGVRDTVSAAERCFALYQEGCYAEVVALGEAALHADPAAARRTRRPHETAALWSVVGLAKQARGDAEGAAFALETAMDVAPDEDRAAYERHLVTLVVGTGRELLARAQSPGAGPPDERLATTRAAITWARRGLAAIGTDPALADLLRAAEDAAWPAYEQVVAVLARRQEFHRARRLLREVLTDPDCPDGRRETFRSLLSASFGGEIGQLTAQAIRSVRKAREEEALAALTRAQRLLDAIPENSLSPARREEVDRRLSWGYTRLGVLRLETGHVEAALEPLFSALKYTDVAAGRRGEARAALIRALETLTEARVAEVRRLAGEGDPASAVQLGQELWAQLRRGTEAGISPDDLAGAFARMRQLFDEIGGPSS